MNLPHLPSRLSRPAAVAALLCAVLVGSSHAADPAAVASERRALDAAVATFEPTAIIEARNRFAAHSAAEPDDPAWHYWVAVSTWRVVPLLQRPDAKRAEQLCTDGLRHAERLVTLDPKHAEGWALLAGLEGLSLSFASPMAGMTVGPKMEEEIRRASTLAPGNPRVALIHGINTLHKPGFVGGGPEPALPLFAKAQKLYAAESVADSTAPAWGRDDAYLWAGRAAMKLKRYAAARDAYRKALDANPDNAWVRGQLLPEAEKAMASASASVK